MIGYYALMRFFTDIMGNSDFFLIAYIVDGAENCLLVHRRTGRVVCTDGCFDDELGGACLVMAY